MLHFGVEFALLRLRAKSTTLSYRTPVYYVDLTLRDDSTLAQSVQAARQEAERQQEAGVDTEALEAMAWLITSCRSANNIMPITFFLPAFTASFFYSA